MSTILDTRVEEKMAESIVLESVDEAARGALWLDEHVPDWYKYIDVQYLSIQDSSMCILGQLDESFPELYQQAGGYNQELGFDVDELVTDGHGYAYLNAAWRREILARQGE